ncbi:nuclear transport factor 2 family protein [Myroides sp. JBRI-B21084]|uniref:nuclear transport factor 2 family protein n=1 Tax=Myroides sp. JBRI-B21084 TaxID=3119977 RepID=UPI0026E30574|nr:nuclear transport factor 2 family protein [Paenimyroides cloacae]WKW47544.1 nuclear transport factor 2 family protein [Paenimyroides cloacae]
MNNPLQIVKKFYESAGILNKIYCLDIFHEDIQLEWHSSKGHLLLEHADLMALSKDLKHSYFDLRAEVHDVMSENNKVMIRYTYYVRTLENPDEELVLATFFNVWELKDNKLYKGVQMSQLANL